MSQTNLPVWNNFVDFVRSKETEAISATHFVETRHHDVECRVRRFYCDFSSEHDESLLKGFIIEGFTNDSSWCVNEYFRRDRPRERSHKIRYIIDVDYDPSKTPDLPAPPPIEDITRYVIRELNNNVETDDEDRCVVFRSYKKLPAISYHICTPAMWDSDSPNQEKLDQVLFLRNPEAKESIRPYVDFNIYGTSAHGLRAPLCDKMDSSAVEPQMRPFVLYRVFNMQGEVDEVWEKYATENLGFLYNSSCLRVRNGHSSALKEGSVLRNQMLFGNHEAAARGRLSVGQPLRANTESIDLGESIYWEDGFVDALIASDQYDTNEDKLEALVLEMNRYFGFIRTEPNKCIIMKTRNDFHQYPSLKHITKTHLVNMFTSIKFPVEKKVKNNKRKTASNLKGAGRPRKRRGARSKEQDIEELVAEEYAEDLENTAAVEYVSKRFKYIYFLCTYLQLTNLLKTEKHR
jgi:hypothetical protein